MGLENRYRRCMPNRKRPPEAGGMQIATPASGSARWPILPCGYFHESQAARLGEHSADHLSYGPHLLAVATEVVVARIAPPVPASLRIAADLA
jgi:hypothetical protein